MEIVVVASDEKKLRSIVSQVKDSVKGAIIITFIDPMLAVKYLINNKADLVFADWDLRKGINIVNFVEIVKQNCKWIDISIISGQDLYNQVLENTSADRILSQPVTKEMLDNIIKEREGYIC